MSSIARPGSEGENHCGFEHGAGSAAGKRDENRLFLGASTGAHLRRPGWAGRWWGRQEAVPRQRGGVEVMVAAADRRSR